MYKIPQTITELNLVLQGVGNLGVTKSFTLPEIKKVMYEQKVASGSRYIDTGRFEPMQFSATLEDFSAMALNMMTISQVKQLDAIIYAYFSFSENGESKKGYMTMTGPIINVNDGTLETGKQVSRKIVVGVNSYALVVNNKSLFMIDIGNNIIK